MTMLDLTPAIRRELKSLAHHLEPKVIVGDAGLTVPVLREIGVHLKSHELIKIRVVGDNRGARDAMMQTICTEHEAAPVQQIGKILVIYRPKPKSAESDAKKSPVRAPSPRKAKRQTRKTKRSYQR